MTKKEKLKEYRSIKGLLPEECGVYCVNCGSRECIEYHHIVPLACGGNNVFSNIVPLCKACHNKAHGVKSQRGYYGGWKTGRPRKAAPEGYKEVITEYIHGGITTEETKKRLGLKSGSRIADQWYYKEYLTENAIEKIEKIRGIRGRVYSHIWYVGGEIETYCNGKRIA